LPTRVLRPRGGRRSICCGRPTQWAVIHDPERLDPETSAKPGREKSRRLGGEGVAEVTEFAAAQFGARIGHSPYEAAGLIADAQDLQLRHPRLWARVEVGEVRASYARHVTTRTRDLCPEAAAYVDEAVAESADGRIPWTRFETLVEAKVKAAAPELARKREEEARRARFAKKLRGEAHGMASFIVRADAATIEQIDAAVSRLARQLVEVMPEATEDDRRVHAVLLLCNPGADPDTEVTDLMPTVNLYLHMYGHPGIEWYADGQPAGGIARLEGHGPVTEVWIRDVLGPCCKFQVQPVLDLEGQAPVDTYEIPDRHRQAVRLMSPADVFPNATSLSRDKQVDHTVPYEQGGESGIGNYGPMATTHHRIKTFGGWQVQQPFPGIYVWRDPHGAFYLVDHTGTRRLRDEDRSDDRLIVVEMWHGPEIRLDWEAA